MYNPNFIHRDDDEFHHTRPPLTVILSAKEKYRYFSLMTFYQNEFCVQPYPVAQYPRSHTHGCRIAMAIYWTVRFVAKVHNAIHRMLRIGSLPILMNGCIDLSWNCLNWTKKNANKYTRVVYYLQVVGPDASRIPSCTIVRWCTIQYHRSFKIEFHFLDCLFHINYKCNFTYMCTCVLEYIVLSWAPTVA